METENSNLNITWQNSKWMIKGLIIGVIALVLMIPLSYVKELVKEREARQKEAATEIAGKWAGPQNIIGPILVIPYKTRDTARKADISHLLYVLPDKLDITAHMDPREKHRGIFKVMLYDAKINLKGSFDVNAFSYLKIPREQIDWANSYVILSIAEQKGLSQAVKLVINDSSVEMNNQFTEGRAGNYLTAPVKLVPENDVARFSFTAELGVKGSGKLFFTPIGKATTVNLSSTWKDPSFSGASLPQASSVDKGGFTATWISSSNTQTFQQKWIDDSRMINHRSLKEEAAVYDLSSTSFGVDLYVPVNGYQKTWRTIKYALLCILLTFATFFIIEVTSRTSAHPFQYGLVGLAMILFYSLLLSISEYTGFNLAYLIASGATITLIAWFVNQIIHSGRATTILSVALILVYSYVFSLLNLQDYSLLFGSIGLFLMLAVIMYFSKKLKWQ